MLDKQHAHLLASIFLFLSTSLLLSTGAAQLQFVYSNFKGANLTLDGVAVIRADGLLQLTNSTDVKGHAFYPTPVYFRRSPNGTVQSFSISFVFAIQCDFIDGGVDGMTFFVAPTMNFSMAFANHFLGLFNDQTDGSPQNHIFAVELDTFQNSELKDIDNNHVGININGLVSKQAHSAGFYDDKTDKFKNLTLSSGEPMQLWIDYDEDTTQISATLAPLSITKPRRLLLQATTNLSNVLKEPSYVGFSGASGPLHTLYYVLAWSFGLSSPSPPINITSLPELPHGHQKKQSSKDLETFLPIATAMFVLVVGIITIFEIRRRLRYAELLEDWEAEFGPHRFSYKDLYEATEGFKNKSLLGEGGFGKVYKGVLPKSKAEVAIKQVSHESRQGMKEFISEIVTIGRLRHRNIVRLLGYCRRKDELILVYDYMKNGSLDKYLHSREEELTLDWAQRFHIIQGVASALLYLHEKWEKVVIHRDIKASNVLLDSEMNGRLGDFGLSRLYDHGTNAQTTCVVGTLGYLAPELLRTGKSSPLTDVFAFGTFLLEVTCGQRPITHDTQDEHIMLVDWVLENWQNGSIMRTVDRRLDYNYKIDEVNMVLKLGLLCTHPLPARRPTMREVMEYLVGNMPLPEMAPKNFSFNLMSFMQNRGFNPSTLFDSETMSSICTFSGLSGGR